MNPLALSTVTEAAADAETAALFADIRDTMGVALVNLIWRHLAVSPAALNWSWQRLKPIYANGAVPEAAWALRQSLDYPGLHAFTAQDRHALGREVDELKLIDAVLRTYERGNAQNLVALCALRLALNPQLKNTASASVSGPSNTQSAVVHDARAEQADRVTEALPPLPAMADLDPAIRADIESLTEVWVPAQHRGMVPSVFRHLAHWPALLAIYRDKLQSIPNGLDSVAELADRAVGAATCLAAPLIEELGTGAPLDEKTQRWLTAALDLFIDGMIGRGVVIVPAMRKALTH